MPLRRSSLLDTAKIPRHHGAVGSTTRSGGTRRLPRRGFVLRLLGGEFHSSAGKHGVAESDVVRALLRTLVEFDLGDDDSPTRRLALGPDRAGNLLEIVVLSFDDDRKMVIHAMRMRSKYQPLIDGLLEGDE